MDTTAYIKLVEEVEGRANAATEGPWESNNATVEMENYQYYQALDPNGKVVFDTLNSDLGVVHEDADEDGGVYRWDEVARCNIAFAAYMRTAAPALTSAVRELVAEREQVTEIMLEAELKFTRVQAERNALAEEMSALSTRLNTPVAKLRDVAQVEIQNNRLAEELAQVKRGEFICKRCGLRKDAEHEDGGF